MAVRMPNRDDVANVSTMIYDVFNNGSNIDFSSSITRYSKKTSVVSRAYIEDNLIDEDIMPDVVDLCNQIYIGYLLSALQLNNVMENYSTVRRAFERISTEAFDDVADIVKEVMGKAPLESATEAQLVELDKKVQHLAAGRLIEFDFIVGRATSVTSTSGENRGNSRDRSNTSSRSQTKSHTTQSSGTSNNTRNYGEDGGYTGESDSTGSNNGSSDQDSEQRQASKGRKSTSSINSSTQDSRTESNGAVTVKVPIHVSIHPASITKAVAEGFLNSNFSPNIMSRFRQWKAGEISFFKDLILAGDLVDKYAKAMKQDKTGVLSDMLNRKNMGRFSWMRSLAKKVPKNNVASSILMFDKKTFEKAAHDVHINFDRFQDRQAFFESSFAMFVVTVDTMYETVNIYYNGLETFTSVPFRMIKRQSGSDGIDLKSLMDTISKNQAPKF